MKYILIVLMIVFCAGGCAKSTIEETQVTITPSVIATETATADTTVSATSETTIDTTVTEPTNDCIVDDSNSSEISEGGFKSVNIGGVFDVLVRDPLPEQMYLEFGDTTNPNGDLYGHISLAIYSSDSNCTVRSSCRSVIYSFYWFTDEALEYDSQHDMIASDDNLVHEYETSAGHIGVYRYYPAQISGSIDDGNGPDYFYDTAGGQLTYAVEDLIRFDKE